MSVLDAALAYAANGWSVFPLVGKVPAIASPHPKGAPKCEGWCGKTGHGAYDATCDTETLREWFAGQYANANIGIGVPDGVVVVDVDKQHDGDKTLNALVREHGADWLVDIPRQRTGRGGLHLPMWCDTPLMAASPSAPGIDIKQRGGYIVAAPSLHPNGNSYRWEIDLPALWDLEARVPAFLVELFRPAPTVRAYGTVRYRPGSDPVNNAAHVYTTWSDLLRRHGWALVIGDGATDGCLWRHPDSTNKYSASMRHDCLFVYSHNTAFGAERQTKIGDTHGITLYEAIVTLDCNNDRELARQRVIIGPRNARTWAYLDAALGGTS
jgi:hypothetical protein